MAVGLVLASLLGRRKRAPVPSLIQRAPAGDPPTAVAVAPIPAPSIVALNHGAVLEAIRRPGEILVVNHWATWCEPCVEELPYLGRLAQELAGRVRFVGISWDRFSDDDGADAVRSRVDEARRLAGAAFESWIAPPDSAGFLAAAQLADARIPQTAVLTRRGAVAWNHLGEITSDGDRRALEGAIAAALSEPL
ncbi:MAG: redoxin family protein [Planctomycetes bacterium]|nr:redoxin family protein [Planctomycetota bacterium]